MAGSLNHIVDADSGKLRLDLVENLGDCGEALEECFHIIRVLSGGSKEKVNAVCRKLNYPEIEHDLVDGREDDE